MRKRYMARRNDNGTYFIFDKQDKSMSSDLPRKKAIDLVKRLNAGEKYIVQYSVYNVETGETTFTGFMSEPSAQETCDKLNTPHPAPDNERTGDQ